MRCCKSKLIKSMKYCPEVFGNKVNGYYNIFRIHHKIDCCVQHFVNNTTNMFKTEFYIIFIIMEAY